MQQQHMAVSRQRRHERAPVSFDASFRAPSVIDFVEAACVNLSQGGMFLCTGRPLLPGTLLKVDVAPDVGQIRGVARVVWVRSRSAAPGKPAGMGVRFLSLEPGGAELIDDAVQRVPSAPVIFFPGAPLPLEPEPPLAPPMDQPAPVESEEPVFLASPEDPRWRAQRLEALVAAQASLYDGAAPELEYRPAVGGQLRRAGSPGVWSAFMKLVRRRSP